MFQSTIVAISTPLGPGGIGVIRLTGDQSLDILTHVFVRKKDLGKKIPTQSATPVESHRVYYGYIIDPSAGSVIDEVLVIYMRAPYSFTREDVVEIHAHSGYVVMERILNTVIDSGAQLAGPGEFSKRAFLNGRIDLSQAEAVIDIINAPSESAARIASSQIRGGMRQVTDDLMDSVVNMRARIEAAIDFSETIDLEQVRKQVGGTLVPLIESLIERQKETEIFKEGRQIAITGAPNVGKSSLLNRLVEKETAIVSEIPGTTRDIVKEYLSINGVPIELCDTAGIHVTSDPVESIGIFKARDQIKRADIVLLVVEGTRTVSESEKQLIDDIPPRKLVVVINKIDIADTGTIAAIEEMVKESRHTCISAKTGSGIQTLKALIFDEIVTGKAIIESHTVIPNLRQRKILESILDDMNKAISAIDQQDSMELTAQHFAQAQKKLEDICGQTNNEALYDKIFEEFCIGK